MELFSWRMKIGQASQRRTNYEQQNQTKTTSNARLSTNFDFKR
jgi:hypothetical protein